MTAFSALLCERHPGLVSFIEPAEADEQAELLLANGLKALNDKVLASPMPGVLDLIAEHNMAAMLLQRGFVEVEYEPSSLSRPVDLVGAWSGRRYRIEVKRLAASDHDMLHTTTMKALNAALKSNHEPVAISLWLAETFESHDINELVRHVKASLQGWHDGAEYYYPSPGDWYARYKVHHSATAEHPRVRATGDANMLNVTGKSAARVQGKIKRAYEQFKAGPADDAFHLVTLEVDKTIHLSSVSDALYGEEYFAFYKQGGEARGRFKNGAFCQGEYSRLGGLVVARRVVSHRLFGRYTLTLFPNPAASLPVDDVRAALGIGNVLGPTDYP